MSNKSQDYPLRSQIPGTISIMSRQNTVHIASLMPDVWEFEHDPDDNFLRKIMHDKQEQLKKRHSYQDIGTKAYLNSIEATLPSSDKFAYYSQLNSPPYNRNEYGLAGLQDQNSRMKKIFSSSKNSIPSRSGSGGSNSQRRKSKQNCVKDQLSNRIEEIVDSNGEELLDSQATFCNRNVDIFEHKHHSNVNYLIRQTKQLLFLNRLSYLQVEGEELRRKVMKLEIQCRKLKIGLRNCSSSGTLLVRKKQGFGSSQSKRSFIRSPQQRSETLLKQKNLEQMISKEKKMLNDLGIREALVTNYYNAIKNKRQDIRANKNLQSESMYNPVLSQFSKIKTSQFKSTEDLKGYFDILSHHRLILRASLQETEGHIDKKCGQLSEERKVLKQELGVIEAQIEKNLDKTRPHQNGSKFRPTQIIRKRQQSSKHELPSQNKSKRRLLFRSPGLDEGAFSAEKGSQFSISKIRSQKQLRLTEKDRAKKEKSFMDPEKNEYYMNMQGKPFH